MDPEYLKALMQLMGGSGNFAAGQGASQGPNPYTEQAAQYQMQKGDIESMGGNNPAAQASVSSPAPGKYNDKIAKQRDEFQMKQKLISAMGGQLHQFAPALSAGDSTVQQLYSLYDQPKANEPTNGHGVQYSKAHQAMVQHLMDRYQMQPEYADKYAHEVLTSPDEASKQLRMAALGNLAQGE